MLQRNRPVFVMNAKQGKSMNSRDGLYKGSKLRLS